MPQFSISITKSTVFRDSVQPFSNIYTYGGIGTMPNEAQAKPLIEEIVRTERLLHSNDVTFVSGRLWSSGGTRAENKMIATIPLTGMGSQGTTADFDRERAVLVQWPAGKDTRGKKVYLRKWFHCSGSCNGVAFSASVKSNLTRIPTADRTSIANQASNLARIGTSFEWGMVAPSGRERDGGDPITHPYLEHHQLGDKWRG
jgi:hypothetical protein